MSRGAPAQSPNGRAKPIPYILATDCVELPVFPVRLVSVPALCRRDIPPPAGPASPSGEGR